MVSGAVNVFRFYCFFVEDLGLWFQQDYAAFYAAPDAKNPLRDKFGEQLLLCYVLDFVIFVFK